MMHYREAVRLKPDYYEGWATWAPHCFAGRRGRSTDEDR
jgi:hypothetical protein